jgi:ABC-type multidrug transport system ATPase subunit
MKQKLALSCALIHRPSVLFLDEPTTGVDAVSRKEFWDMLKKLKSDGITILVSTPYMDEASLCDRIALIQSGALLSIDTPQRVIASFNHPLLAMKSRNMLQLLNDLQSLPQVENAYPFGEYHHVVMKDSYDSGELLSSLKGKGNESVIVEKAEPNIEDCFIELMRE